MLLILQMDESSAMKASESSTDDFALELFSLQLDLEDGVEDNVNGQTSSQVQSPFDSAPGSVGYMTPTKPLPELMNLGDGSHLPSMFCPELNKDFSNNLLDQLLLLQNQPEDLSKSNMDSEVATHDAKKYSRSSVHHTPYYVPVSAPVDGTSMGSLHVSHRSSKSRSGSHSRSTSPRKIAPKRSRSNTHTPVTYPTPATTPPSPYYANPAGGKATPVVVTPSAVTPVMSPENSNPGSPRGGYYIINKPVIKDTVKEEKVPRHKRPSHIRAEHKRRSKIQKGFDDLQCLVPALATESSSSKPSKATMLGKTVDYGRQLKSENKELQRESEKLRKEVEALNQEIKLIQATLPSDHGDAAAAAGRHRGPPDVSPHMEKMYSEYLRSKTFSNWKFSIFGKFIRPLFIAYNKAVNSSPNVESFCQSALKWLEENCSLIALRPVMFEALRQVSTETSIITDPAKVPEEVIQNVMRESFPDS